MKRVNYLLVGLLALSSLVGCSKDESSGGGNDSGDIYTAFSIKIGGPGTYATEAGDAVESTVGTVTVYIFDGSILGAHDDIAISGTGALVTGTTTIATSLGKKTIYALINSPGNITVPNVENGVTTIDAFKVILDQAVTRANVAKDGQFLMFGVTEATLEASKHDNEANALSNPIPISVNRVSTKVTFLYDAPSVTKNNLVGDFTEQHFALNQTEKTVEIARELRNQNITSGAGEINYTPTTTSYVAGSGSSLGTYDHLEVLDKTALTATFKQAAAVSNVTDFGNSHYCLENINDGSGTNAATNMITTGKVTFVVVRTKFVPAANMTTDGGDFSIYATSTTITEADDSFWTVEHVGVKHIFGNLLEANAIIGGGAALENGEVQKHEQGYGYYRLNLRDIVHGVDKMTERYAVLRNNVYKVDVQTINGVGEGDPDNLIPDDPETPVETTGEMTAAITILEWTVVGMPSDLD